MIALSENVKLRFDPTQGKVSVETDAPQPDTSQFADAEAQMRRALGLFGGGQRPRQEAERPDLGQRSSERFSSPAAHRRRFVQDGDIPVTVVRRDASVEAAAGPSSSRLLRVETALAAETAARQQAERALSDAVGQNRELQTKYGHAELVRTEAVETLRREREELTALRQVATSHAEALREAEERAEAAEQAREDLREELAEERRQRKTAERALRESEEARADAEELLAERLAEDDAAPRGAKTAKPAIARVLPRRVKPVPEVVADVEPEPVKWWLTPAPAAKRR